MSGRVVLTGLDELRQFLTTAPEKLRAEALPIVHETTEGAANEIRAGYGQQTGNLKSKVTTVYPAGGVLAGIVLSKAPHASIYEKGTKQRQTKSGANRGVMPAHPVTAQVAPRRRARMVEQLIALVRRFGFEVTST